MVWIEANSHPPPRKPILGRYEHVNAKIVTYSILEKLVSFSLWLLLNFVLSRVGDLLTERTGSAAVSEVQQATAILMNDDLDPRPRRRHNLR